MIILRTYCASTWLNEHYVRNEILQVIFSWVGLLLFDGTAEGKEYFPDLGKVDRERSDRDFC